MFGDLGSVPYEHCFVAGTPISLGGGQFKPVEEVRKGDRVLVPSESDPLAGVLKCGADLTGHGIHFSLKNPASMIFAGVLSVAGALTSSTAQSGSCGVCKELFGSDFSRRVGPLLSTI